MLSLVFLVGSQHHCVFAQEADDPLVKVKANTDKGLKIIKGPIATFGGAVVLLGGVAGLLRGNYQLAVSCAVAYAALLFLNNSSTGRGN
jgi:hypothetical protein